MAEVGSEETKRKRGQSQLPVTRDGHRDGDIGLGLLSSWKSDDPSMYFQRTALRQHGEIKMVSHS